MNKDNLLNKIPYLIKQRNIIAILLAIMITGNLLLAVNVISNSQITVILPSQISGSYKIQGNKVNDIYLKDRALELIRVILNITPDSLDNMYKTVLRATPPAHHFSLKTELKKLGKEVTNRNIATAFYPLSVEVDSQNLTADIYGEFYTFFGGSFKKDQKSYRLKFTYTGQQLSLLEFFEIKEENEN